MKRAITCLHQQLQKPLRTQAVRLTLLVTGTHTFSDRPFPISYKYGTYQPPHAAHKLARVPPPSLMRPTSASPPSLITFYF